MSTRRTCPVCGGYTLTVRFGIAGRFVLCANGCARSAIVTALTITERNR